MSVFELILRKKKSMRAPGEVEETAGFERYTGT